MEVKFQNIEQNIDKCDIKCICKFCGKNFSNKKGESKHRLNSCKLNSDSKISQKRAQKLLIPQKIQECNEIIKQDIDSPSKIIEKTKIILKMSANRSPTKENSSNNTINIEKLGKVEMDLNMFREIDDNKNPSITNDLNSGIFIILAKMCESQQKSLSEINSLKKQLKHITEKNATQNIDNPNSNPEIIAKICETHQELQKSFLELQKSQQESVSEISLLKKQLKEIVEKTTIKDIYFNSNLDLNYLPGLQKKELCTDDHFLYIMDKNGKYFHSAINLDKNSTKIINNKELIFYRSQNIVNHDLP